MLSARFLPPAVFLGGALALVVAAVVMTALLWAGNSPASAQDDNETKVPAKPTGLSVATEQGSLDVLADWDDVEGVDDYLVRWRPKDGQLNDGTRVASSSAAITVDDYGEWVVRVQACNDAGCGKPLAQRFSVEPAPEPTPTPTPEPTPEPTATPEPTPEPGFRVSIAADATELKVNEEVTLTAVITNAPSDQVPGYQWQLDLGGGSWYSAGKEATFLYLQNNAGSSAFRVTVTYGSADSATSDPVTITWVPPNRAPVVDDQAEPYAAFVGTGIAPRGTLVSKVYDGIFSDPDGDELTYTVSVPADLSELVDTVYVLESAQRVFIRLEAEDDWGAVEPQLPTPLVTTVTLTATDPDGLSASVTGDFQTNWEQHEILAVCDRTPQVRDALVALVGKACKDIGAADLIRVVKLDLSNTGMSSLRQGDFSGMSSLRSVNISSNNFTSWTAACAASFGDSVQNIDLTNNKLGGTTGAQIPMGCFTATKFPNLVSLHLAATRINSLADDPFDGLTKLEILDLSQNQITAVPVAAFNDLSNLWYLDLGRNALTSSGLPVNETSGGDLTDAVFNDLSSLEWLALNNQFAQDPDNNYEPITDTTDTDFTSLSSLDDKVFTGLSSLKELDLANNRITTAGLPDGIFTPLSSLESMALFGNSGSPWTVAQLRTKGVRNDGTNLLASVIQVVTPPSGFTAEPVSGGVKLSWDDPSDTSLNHEYRYLVVDGADWTAWKDISSTTTSGTKLEHTVSSDVSSGKTYVFQLRSEKSGAHSYRANADCNAIFGTSGNDTLTGSPDPDCIIGLAGNDTLKGGASADELDGGAGTDTANYQGSARDVTVNLSDNTASGGDAEGDSLDNIENIIGSNFGDTLTGDANANNIRGHGGDDTVEGLAGGDKLWGEGGTGDTLSYASSNAGVTVSIANQTASGGHAQGDTGLGGFENLIGSAHDDSLTGDGNANVIEGGDGEDTLAGGAGTDTLSYASSNLPVWADIGTPTFKLGDAAGDTVSGFENLIGSENADILVGDDNDNVIEGLAGQDELDGGAGSDTLSYASSDDSVYLNFRGGHFTNPTSESGSRDGGGGHAEGDIISNFENAIGSDYPDYFLIAAAGNTIDGGYSFDDGKSTIYFPLNDGDFSNSFPYPTSSFSLDLGDVVDYRWSTAGVTVNLTTGTNTGGYAEGDILTGIESIVGSAFADTLTGDENNNTFYGRGGADTFDGKGGIDVVSYARHPSSSEKSYPNTVGITLDLKTAGNSTEHAVGDTYTDIEWFVGSWANDVMQGGDDDDKMHGHNGRDTLRGGAGDDTLYGPDPWELRYVRQDGDALYGEAGDDTIIVGFGDSGRGGAGNDKILAMGVGWYFGDDGTDEFYFHQNYFPSGSSPGQISNPESTDKIYICLGSGAGDGMNDSDGEVSWTKNAEHLVGPDGDNGGVQDTRVYVKLQIGTKSVSQGSFVVVNEPDVTKVTVEWSDPDADDGTGCNSFGLDEVPTTQRMLKTEIGDLFLSYP